MNVPNINCVTYAKKLPCFTAKSVVTNPNLDLCLKNMIKTSIDSFSESILMKVPDSNLYGFKGMVHFIKGVEALTSYTAMLELKLPLNNPDPKYNTIKRLTLSLYDSNKPGNIVTSLLVKGKKQDILNYLRDKNTPEKIKKLIEEDKKHLSEDMD